MAAFMPRSLHHWHFIVYCTGMVCSYHILRLLLLQYPAPAAAAAVDVCRLVYVRSVEVLSTQGRDPTVSLSASAKALTAAAAAAAAGSSSPVAAAAKPSSNDAAAASAAAAAAPAGAASETAATPKASSSTAASSSSRDQGQGQQHSSPSGPSYAAAVGVAASDANAAADAASAVSAAGAGGSSGGAGGPQQWLQPPPGTTELPTCPVCLERLDEHISGIVTTVSGIACTTHE